MKKIPHMIKVLVAWLSVLGLSMSVCAQASASEVTANEPYSSSVTSTNRPEVAATDNIMRIKGRVLDASSLKGIKLSLADGDTVVTESDSFRIIDSAGNTVIGLATQLSSGQRVAYDASTKTIYIETTASNGLRSCNPWAKWIVQTWGDLGVCTPAALGALGLGGGIVSAFVAAGCHGGISALLTLMGC